jgi:integrase
VPAEHIPGSGFVFTNSLGKPRQRRDVQRAFNKARDNAALQVTRDGRVVFHSLRHTRISRLANNRKIPLPHVQAFARHTKLETTLDYVHKVEDATVTSAILSAV